VTRGASPGCNDRGVSPSRPSGFYSAGYLGPMVKLPRGNRRGGAGAERVSALPRSAVFSLTCWVVSSPAEAEHRTFLFHSPNTVQR
jgi:hypothetical protein